MRHRSVQPQVAGSRPLHSFQGPLLPDPVRSDGRMRLLPQGSAHHAAQARLDLSGPSRRALPSCARSFHGLAGRGLVLALGMGSAARLDGRPSRTYVVLGDGEIQEGQIWEAAMFAGFYKLDNVVRHRRLQRHPARRLREGHHGSGAARREVARLRLARHRDRRPRYRRACRTRFAEAARDERKADLHHRPHHQRQRRFLHGRTIRSFTARRRRAKKCAMALQELA